MKTEIERICEIMETLLAHEPIIDVPYETINDIAVALVKEGYGDVSEYKAEIERLKDKCEELRNEKWDVQDDLDCYCDEMPNKIKQAQIDVLKKIKNCREATDSDCYPYLERIVNKLIEEVQNAEDKG